MATTYRIAPIAEKLGIPYDEALALADRGDFPPTPVDTEDGAAVLVSPNYAAALGVFAQIFRLTAEDEHATPTDDAERPR